MENNNQDFNKYSSQNNTLISILKTILIIIACLFCLFLIVFMLYKTTIDVSDQNLDKFDYDLSNVYNENHDFKEFISYNSLEDENNINVSISKPYFYNEIINIWSLNNELNSKYNININKFGLFNNINKTNVLDLYLDVTYNNIIDAYITCSISYHFNENDSIVFSIENVCIGDGLPRFLYNSLISSIYDFSYVIDSNDFIFLKERLLTENGINKIKINKNEINFRYNFSKNLNTYTNFIIGNNTSNESELHIILELLIGDNAEQYSEFNSIFKPMLLQNKKLVSLFNNEINNLE